MFKKIKIKDKAGLTSIFIIPTDEIAWVQYKALPDLHDHNLQLNVAFKGDIANMTAWDDNARSIYRQLSPMLVESKKKIE